MKIIARCHPLLEPLLPKPYEARTAFPDWLKSMPGETVSKTLGGEMIRTLKHCPPFIDALSLGIMVPLSTDVRVADGEVHWDWDPPIIPDAPLSRAPVGVHVPEQASGSPLSNAEENRFILKFTNFWAFETEPGWSLLFCHPFNRADLPFKTLTGVVDCDRFSLGYVHFPAILDPDFEGVIEKGTPIAQVVPVRRETLEMVVSTMREDEISGSRAIQEKLGEETGVYRRDFRD